MRIISSLIKANFAALYESRLGTIRLNIHTFEDN